MAQLDSGATFPNISLKLGDRDSITLPADVETDFAVVLFYRGHW